MNGTRVLPSFLALGSLLVFCHRVSAVVPTPAPTGVYWDVYPGGEDSTSSYMPRGRYSALIDHLEEQDYQFTVGSDPLDLVDLNQFRVVVIADGSDGLGMYTPQELNAISEYVNQGGGLLLMTEINGSSATLRMQPVVGLFGASILRQPFQSTDINSTNLVDHPALKGVDQVFFRFSSPILPGDLTPIAFHFDQVMVAAGNVGQGRVAIVADGDAFTLGDLPLNYFNRADNRQFATSLFAYLSVPEPATSVSLVVLLGTLLLVSPLKTWLADQ